MTHTHCPCGRRIPWGEERYLILRGGNVIGEFCFECVTNPRGSTATASGHTPPTTEAEVPALGDSASGWASESQLSLAPPERQMPVRRDE